MPDSLAKELAPWSVLLLVLVFFGFLCNFASNEPQLRHPCLVRLAVVCATSGASAAGTVAMQSESSIEINP